MNIPPDLAADRDDGAATRMALEPVQALLKEAVSVPVAQDAEASALKADHDENHT